MRAVGELHQQHPHILAHRHQQLAEILRLGAARKGFDGKPAQLGDAVDKLRDITAEFGLQRFKRDIAILDSVVEQCGDNGILVQTHVRKNVCHGHGMREIGLSRRAGLAVMGNFAEFEGTRETAGIHGTIIGAHLFNDGISRSDHAIPDDRAITGSLVNKAA